MKLFKSLLVAPATLGLLAPMSATANEVTVNDFNPASESTLLAGGEGLVDDSYDGGFSETTTASFGVDFVIGAVDGGTGLGTEKTTFDYQMGIGLETSFTGEDSLGVTIDIGGGTANTATDSTLQTSVGAIMGLDATQDVLTVDGVTYSFPLGGATVLVGDNTDISALYTGACAYNAFTDFMGNCGTGNSVGVGGNGATAAMSYAFDGGFSLAGGLSSSPDGILTKEGTDTFGVEAAYTADSYGVSVAYADAQTTTYWGINGMYAFDFATISAGVESEDADASDTKTGFFVGLSFPEVGPGSFDIGMATTGNFADSDPEYYVYEASYAYPVNDGMTITPGIYTKETSGDDETGVIVKTSFSF